MRNIAGFKLNAKSANDSIAKTLRQKYPSIEDTLLASKDSVSAQQATIVLVYTD